jgi:uncharacterized phage protein (TIGR02218 family)
MKTISVALENHYAQGSTTIARCWKATRRDGEILTVTTCANDLLVDGLVYRSSESFTPKAISQEATAAVVNTEVEGALSEDMTEFDFEAGKWDGATVEVFEVNYRDLSMGKLWIATATMGDITVSRSAFNAELRGLSQVMQKPTGLQVLPTCFKQFGDSKCRVDLAPITVTGTLTSVVDRRTFSDSSRAESDDYFGAGLVRMTSGEAEGEEIEVYSFASTQFVTHLPFKRNIAEGDTYEAIPGCRKRFNEDCKAKWSNGNNFGGAPKVPGPDRMLGLGGTEGTSL